MSGSTIAAAIALPLHWRCSARLLCIFAAAVVLHAETDAHVRLDHHGAGLGERRPASQAPLRKVLRQRHLRATCRAAPAAAACQPQGAPGAEAAGEEEHHAEQHCEAGAGRHRVCNRLWRLVPPGYGRQAFLPQPEISKAAQTTRNSSASLARVGRLTFLHPHTGDQQPNISGRSKHREPTPSAHLS